MHQDIPKANLSIIMFDDVVPGCNAKVMESIKCDDGNCEETATSSQSSFTLCGSKTIIFERKRTDFLTELKRRLRQYQTKSSNGLSQEELSQDAKDWKDIVVDFPLIPPFETFGGKKKKPIHKRRVPNNPKYSLPIRIIMKQMKSTINELNLDRDDEERARKILKKILRKKLHTIVSSQVYTRSSDMARLFREHHPKADDKQFLDSVLEGITSGVYDSMDASDREDGIKAVSISECNMPGEQKGTVITQESNKGATDMVIGDKHGEFTDAEKISEDKQMEVKEINNSLKRKLESCSTISAHMDGDCSSDENEIKKLKVAHEISNGIQDSSGQSEGKSDSSNTIQLNDSENIVKAFPNSRFVLPIMKLLKEMKNHLKQMELSHMEVEILELVLKRRLRELMTGKGYMNYKAQVALFREHHPKERDKEYLQNIVQDIACGKLTGIDSDLEAELANS